MHTTIKLFSIFGILTLFVAGASAVSPQQGDLVPRNGAGDLLVAPTRIVFAGPKRTAELNLLNIGEKAALYRISLIHQRMTEDGKLVDIESPNSSDKFADDLVRFTPRQVLLEPHVAQIVRIQLRLPADLETGEYRSHLLFRAVSAPAADDKAPSAAQPPKGLTVQITPIYGVSIPVIVRHGQTTATTSFAETHLAAAPSGEPILVGRLVRSGNASVYGDLVVEFAEKGRPYRVVSRANGLAIYTPNAVRNFAMLLSGDKTLRFQHGTVRTTYRQPETDGGQTIAKSEIVLP